MSAEYEVELKNWLTESFRTVYALHGWLLSLVRVFRTSSSRADVFIANLETGLTLADDSEASVRMAREVGGLIVQQSVEGEQARLDHSVFTLRMWHLEGGRGRSVVGYLVVFEGVLFVYLLASAAKQNLQAQHAEDNANAACETLRTVTRTVTDLAATTDPDYRQRTMFTDETRPARSEDAGNALIRTWSANRAWVEISGVSYDTTDPEDVKALRRLITFAADERDTNTRRMAKGKAALLVSHHLPDTAYWTCPFTHATKFVEHTDLVSGRVFSEELKNTLDVNPLMAESLPAVVRAVLAHARLRQDEGLRVAIDWEVLAEEVTATHQLRARGPAMMKNGRLLSELTGPGAALKRLIQLRYITAWRTGRLPWVTTFAGNIGALAERLEVLKTSRAGLITAKGWVNCPIPIDGWGVTDAEWDELERLLQPTSPTAGRPPSGWQSCVNTSTWIDGDLQYRAQWNKERIEVHHRPAAMAITTRGTPAGWSRTKNASKALTAVGTINGRAFCDQLADRLETLATQLADQVAPLTLSLPCEAPRSGRLAVLGKQLDEADTSMTRYQAMLEGARDRSNEGRGLKRQEMVDGAEKDITRYSELLQGISAEREALQALINAEQHTIAAPSTKLTATADFSTLELVAAGLRIDWSQHGGPMPTALPEALGRATRSLHRNRYRMVRNSLSMDWTMAVTIALRDGGEATSTICGSLPNRLVRTDARAALPGGFDPLRDGEVLARRYLVEGASYEELGRELGIDGSGKANSHLLKQLKDWLAGRTGGPEDGPMVESMHYRRVILDIPIRETAGIIFRHIARESHPADVDPTFASHIIATYFDHPDAWWPECWTPHDWKLSRSVMRSLENEDPLTGLAVKDLMRLHGASYQSIISLAGPGAPQQAQVLRRPPVFKTNFLRVPRLAFDDRRLLAKLHCDNPVCPERGGGVGGKAVRARIVVATHILWAPEVPTGALCPHCRTMPGQPDIVFPAAYLQNYRRTSRIEHGTRSRTVLAA